ncbi:hypothetical protein BH23ACT5_BH23ACT5_11240 [soil metagenome]
MTAYQVRDERGERLDHPPRMAARVFAYVLAEDSDRYTAAELAVGLGVSRQPYPVLCDSWFRSGC